MAFKFDDIFDETRRKLSGYFGTGQPGLGTFGKQVKRTVRPVTSFVRKNYQPAKRIARQTTPYSLINRRIVQPQVQRAKREYNAYVKPAVKSVVQPALNRGRIATSALRGFTDYARDRAENTSVRQAPIENVFDFSMQIPQSFARSAVSAGLSMARKDKFTPKGEFQKLALKPYDVKRPTKRGVEGLERMGVSEGTSKVIGPGLLSRLLRKYCLVLQTMLSNKSLRARV